MIKRLSVSLVAASLLSLSVGVASFAQEPGEPAIGIGGRVEVPDMGYALTAPDGWVSIHPSGDDADAIIEALNEIDPDLAATTESALAGGVSFSFLSFGGFDAETGFRENCNVIDYATEGLPLEVMLEADVASFGDMGDQLASGPEVMILELPAGQIPRLSYGLQYPDLETAHAAYYFSDGLTNHLLTCTSLERPEDDWLSVAETFEFLAPQE
jgi:hypothetical protein